MNPIDYALYSAMNTIELSLSINKENGFRHDAQLAKTVMAKMRRLKKNGTISKKVYRYFIDSLQPSEQGFHSRWLNRYARYLEINETLSELKGKADKECLMLLLSSLENKGVLTRCNIGDKLEFNDEEGVQVARSGFVGVTENQLKAFDETGKLKGMCLLSCRLPDRDTVIKVMRQCQTYGFSLYQPETDVQPKKVSFIALIK